MAYLWILAILLIVILIAVPVHFYNRGITLENRCRESWSNVDTELKRRHDLVPNLVAAVKGSMKHERSVLEAVTRARTEAAAPHRDAEDQARTERPLVAALERLLAVAEDYPDLKVSKNFLGLQKELAITEDRIQAARRFYNGNVREHANLLRTFPGNQFARLYRFQPIPYFEVEPVHRQNPTVAL